MKQKIVINLLILPAILCAFAASVSAQLYGGEKRTPTADGEYVIMQSAVLKKAVGGIDGRLELLRDARVNDDISLIEMNGETSELDDLNTKEAEIKEMFEKVPPRTAIFRLLDARGRIAASKSLQCVRAEFKAVKLYATAKPTFEVICNYQNAAPVWGAESRFAEIAEGKIQWLEAFDSKTNEKVEMAFVNSHRIGWEFGRAAKGKSRDILSVYTGWKTSPTDADDGDFLVYYWRFHFDGTRWIRYERTVEEDYWEDEFGFPKPAKFPKAR